MSKAALNTLEKGDAVRLHPTEGGYQKDRFAKVVRKTATLLVVQPDEGGAQERYRLSDGSPFDSLLQGFPRYHAQVLEG